MVIDRVSSEFSTNERAENEIKSLGTSKIWANEDRLRSPKGVGDPRFGASLGLPHHARRSNLIDDPLSSQYDRRFRRSITRPWLSRCSSRSLGQGTLRCAMIHDRRDYMTTAPQYRRLETYVVIVHAISPRKAPSIFQRFLKEWARPFFIWS